MYRVYDTKEKRWINDVYMLPNNTLFTYKKKLFGSEKLVMLRDDERYVVHQDIKLQDMNNTLIFEGDICEINNLGVFGVVAYSAETGGYCIFDELRLDYYPITIYRASFIEVIGNVFDNADLLEDSERDDANANI